MRKIEATFSRAALLVKVNGADLPSSLRFGLTLDEARALALSLGAAVAEGDAYCATQGIGRPKAKSPALYRPPVA
jgi:hypothetical protein